MADLDIEKGPPTGYASFVNRIRGCAEGCDRSINTTVAPNAAAYSQMRPSARFLKNAPFDTICEQFVPPLQYRLRFRLRREAPDQQTIDNKYCGLSIPKIQ